MLFKLDRWLDWKFDIPGVAEQERIYEILATWDHAIARVESLVENNKAQKKALMSQLLTGKKRLPMFSKLEWNFRSLGEICIVKGEYGANAPSIPFSSNEPRYLRITDIDEYGELGGADPRSVSSDSADRKYLANGDVVFARSGATVGKTYLHCSGEQLVFAGYLIRFRPDQNLVVPGFLAQFLKSDEYWGWVSTMIRAGAQPNINAQEYASLVIPLPSIEEQTRITKILRGIDDQHVNFIKQLRNLRIQRQALLQQLLTGKRRVRVQELAA
jgi:type I restriction enzyme S subunit